MILFQEDWDYYPNAIVDTKTKNTSFLRLGALYREMGVKNNCFHLQLHDPGLQGVDPFDKNLSQEMKDRITIECKNNFFYFIREIARDPQSDPSDPILFQANRGIIAAYWFFFLEIVFFLIMIRQTGKSFGIDWLKTYLLNIRLTRSEISSLTKDEKLRGREVDRLKGMEKALPAFLQQRGDRDPGNTEVIRISSLENFLKLYVPNKSPKIADTIGRGMTSPTIFVDEIAYLFNNWITVPTMLSASGAARELARRKNEPNGVAFMTTSGKRDTPEGRFAYNLVSSAYPFTEHLFDRKNIADLEDVIRKGANNKLRVNITMNHQQLGKTDAWLANRIEEAIVTDPTAIDADYFNRWPSGTIDSPHPKGVPEQIQASEDPEPYLTFTRRENYTLRWYYKEHELAAKMEEAHTLGLDTSEAIGRDAISGVLRNIYTGEVAMTFDISETNVITFAGWLTTFLIENPKVTLVPERRSTGSSIIDYVILNLIAAGINPFTRIFNTLFQEGDAEVIRVAMSMRFHREEEIDPYRKYFGYATSGSGTTSRRVLYSDTLTHAGKLTALLVRDKKLIQQLLGLTIVNGRIDHAPGEHDDLVIAFLLSYWLIYLGKNLHLYGIDASAVFSRNPIYLKRITTKNSYEQMEIARAQEAVREITEELKTTKDEFVAIRLERDLERFIAKLPNEDRIAYARDDFLNKLREERQRNNRRIMSSTYSDQKSLADQYRGYESMGMGEINLL